MSRESDPLLRRVGALEGPSLGAEARARIVRRAEAELRGDRTRWHVALRVARIGVPGALLAAEAMYVVKAVMLMARVFG